MALFDFLLDDEERSRRFRQRLQAQQGFDQVNEAQRRGAVLSQAAELNEECDRLHGQLQEAKADLAKSRALYRLSLIKQDGLVHTIRHLKEKWQPLEASEADLKQSINPLVKRMIDSVENSPEAMASIDARVNEAFPHAS